MQRILIFALLFPPLALIVFLWREISTDMRLPPGEFVSMSYVVASVPAWLTATVDWSLSVKFPKLRIVGTTIAGFVIAVSFAWILFRGFGYPSFTQVALMGAIPALVCVLLPGIRIKKEKTES